MLKGLRKKETYEELINELDKDYIKHYPNRNASQIENSNYLSQLQGGLDEIVEMNQRLLKEKDKDFLLHQLANKGSLSLHELRHLPLGGSSSSEHSYDWMSARNRPSGLPSRHSIASSAASSSGPDIEDIPLEGPRPQTIQDQYDLMESLNETAEAANMPLHGTGMTPPATPPRGILHQLRHHSIMMPQQMPFTPPRSMVQHHSIITPPHMRPYHASMAVQLLNPQQMRELEPFYERPEFTVSSSALRSEGRMIPEMPSRSQGSMYDHAPPDMTDDTLEELLGGIMDEDERRIRDVQRMSHSIVDAPPLQAILDTSSLDPTQVSVDRIEEHIAGQASSSSSSAVAPRGRGRPPEGPAKPGSTREAKEAPITEQAPQIIYKHEVHHKNDGPNIVDGVVRMYVYDNWARYPRAQLEQQLLNRGVNQAILHNRDKDYYIHMIVTQDKAYFKRNK
jgi:hypothetical protein